MATPPPPPLLSLAGLRKRYGALTVADGIDLAVGAGEAVGVIGPNGAGKSTLFGLIAGEVRPDAGRVLLDGEDITALPPQARARRGVARSFQIPRPFGGMTVFENLLVGACFGAGQGMAAARARCAAVLDRTGLRGKADWPAGRLTLLDRKRLELARALAVSPRLLLLDEIAGGLTEAEAQAVVETVRAVHAGGTAVVWVEHVLHALVPAVSRLIVLASGRVVAAGEPRALLASDAVREVYLGIDDEIGA